MKRLLSCLALLLSVVICAFSEVNYVLQESFENGQLPQGWTQEFVKGQQNWTVESNDLVFPTGAADGVGRIALRNESSQTIGYTTRLVTPVMDLSEVFQPIVIFSHAQQQRTGDFDRLKVYYRSGQDRDWVELRSFDQKIPGWVQDTIALDAPSKTYQLAFEAADNFGRGVVLDNIRVRSMPTCDNPTELQVNGLTTQSFSLRWIGSLDTDSFEVLVNKTELDPDLVDEDNLFLRAWVDPAESGFLFETGNILTRNTTYYVYVRAHCSGELSEWASITVKTQNIIDVPYYLDFNNWSYLPGSVMKVASFYWTQGTDIEGNASPFINVNDEPGSSNCKARSVDGTHCLIFAGSNSNSKEIPAGSYVYGATPELNVANVKDLAVSFMGTAYQYFGNYNSKEWAAGLIVGVMTDPADLETFEVIDTVWAKAANTFAYYQIPLSSYEGNGKYIALMSRFDKPNLFFIDNFSITAKEDSPLLPTFDFSVQDGNAIKITPNTYGATSWDLFITANTDNISLTPKDELLLFSKTGITEESFTVVADTIANTCIQIYVRANGIFGLPERVLMPEKLTSLPRFMNFKTANNIHTVAELRSIWEYSTGSGKLPEGMLWKYGKKYGNPTTLSSTSTTSISGYSDTYYAYFYNEYKKGEEKEEYMALPPVGDVKQVQLSFYLSGPLGSYPDDIATVAIGVMDDPYDLSTFVGIDTVVGEKARYNQYLATFENYQGTGKFIALRGVPSVLQEDNSKTSQTMMYAYFDDIKIDSIAGCNAAAGIQKVVSDTSFTLNWAANGASKWNVKIYANAVEKKVREGVYQYTAEETDLIEDKDLTSPSYELKGLSPHATLAYQVNTICGEDTLPGKLDAVTTDCAYDGENLPYFEGFEGYQNVGSGFKKIATCWTTKFLDNNPPSSSGVSQFSPYISNTTAGSTYVHSGTAYFRFGAEYNTTVPYVALPKFNVDSVNHLQISFWAKGALSSYQDTILVGVMTDPSDIKTFEAVTEAVINSTDWTEYILSLDGYKGKGEYVALKLKKNYSHYYYMDDFKVKMQSTCGIKVSGVEATRMDTATAFKWAAQDVSGYEILIAKEELEDLEAIDASKVLLRKQIAIPYDTVANTEAAFASNTQYYVYVRTYCSASNTGEWSNVVAFKTSCMPETPEAFGVEDFTSTERFDCWTPGINVVNNQGGNPTMNAKVVSSYYLYLYDVKFTTTAGKEKGGQSYVIMPALNVDSIKNVEITFQAHCGATSTYKGILDIGVCVDGFDSYIKVNSLELKTVTSVAAAANYGFNEAPYYTIRLTDYIGDAEGRFGKKIVLLGRGNKDANNYVYLKNLSVRHLSELNEPINVTIPDSTISVGQAIVNWDAQEGATGYEIKYATANIDPYMDTVLVAGTDVTIKTVTSTTNTVTLTELPGLTNYYVYVRSTNATTQSIWSNMRLFKSSCPLAFELPFSENFDSYTSGAAYIPDCWERFFNPTSATTATACVYASAKNGSTGNGLYVGSTLKNGPSYFALPKMEKAVKELMISFAYKSNSKTATPTTSGGPNRYMAIGVASDISTQAKLLETVVWLDTIINSDNSAFKDYSFAFDKYTGTGEHIIFCGYGGSDARKAANSPEFHATNSTVGGLYIDDLLIEKIPTCFPATVEHVTSTTSSLTVAIADNFGQTAWDLAFVPAGGKVTDVTPLTVAIDDTIKGGYFLVGGLNHSTLYDVYARANCGGGDVSKWSKPVSMRTNVKRSLAQSNWDFEYTADERANYLVSVPKTTLTTYLTDPSFTEGNVDPAATYSYYPVLYPTSVPSSATAAKYGYNSYFSMRLNSTTSYPNQWFALPEIDADLDTLQLRFDATSVYMSNGSTKGLTTTYAKGTTYAHSVKVGVMEDPTDWKTFELLDEFVFPEVTAANDTLIGDSMGYWNHYTINLFGASAKGKYIAFASDYKIANQAYIDNIVVEQQASCAAPGSLHVVDSTLTATTADIVWASNKLKWNLQVIELIDDTTNNLVIDSIVTVPSVSYETKCAVKGLKSNTKYLLRVQSICSDEDRSAWAEKNFETPCASYSQAESVWTFEENLVPFYISGSTRYEIPECWNNGAINVTRASGAMAVSTTSTDFPYAAANTTSSLWAQGSTETDARALRFYLTPNSTTAKIAWVQMPALEKTDHMQLHFWMRASYATKSSKKMQSNASYIKKLYIGTLSDIDDFKTFQKLDSVTYSKSIISTDLYTDDEDEYWEEFLVPLDALHGARPVIAMIGDNTSTTNIFVDNLEVLPDDYCFRPTGVVIDSIYADRAKITWRKSNRDVQVQVATSENFNVESIIIDSICAADQNAVYITGLPAKKTLYYRTRSACGGESYSDWNKTNEFQTLAKPFFRETFTALTLFPEGWTRYSKLMRNVVDTIADQIGSPISPTVTTNWYRYPSAIGLPAGHLKDNIYSSSHNTWIVSERIDLTQLSASDHVALSFDLAMTDGKEHKGAEPDRITGVDDAFVVAITLDNGHTWKSEDLTVWANRPLPVHIDATTKDTTFVNPTHIYNNISSKFGGEKVYVDLSKYVGKVINFAFYGESTVINADNDIHIDNVQINTYNLKEYNETVCRWIDYEDEDFSIGVEDYKPGQVAVYQKYTAGNILGADRLASLNLSVLEEQRLVIDTTMCEGRKFDEYNFNIETKESGVFQQKLSCSTGCDSVVQLNLTVIPSIVVDTVVSICHGRYVDFCGEQYYTSGNYECTFTSDVTNCDSIVRLHLTVRDVLRSSETRYLCPDAQIEIGDTTITTAGTYDILLDANGCDSIVTLTVVDAPKDSVMLRAAIIEGTTYNEGIWHGLSLPGDYPVTLANAYGCDSVVVLHLMVVPADGVLHDTVLVDQLPYILDGQELLGKNTQPGKYTFQQSREGVTFKIEIVVITEDMAIVAPEADGFAVLPNPAKVGQPIFISGNLAANATVSVIAIDGSVVYAAQSINDGMIPGIPAAGIYLVSINNNGVIKQAKLIVR